MTTRVLLVKLSSLGDVVHTYPAVSDLARARPDVEVDWLVEEAFAGLAGLHPAVRNVIPVRLRALKKKGLREKLAHFRELRGILRGKYDLVIDAQGLIKGKLHRKIRLQRMIELLLCHVVRGILGTTGSGKAGKQQHKDAGWASHGVSPVGRRFWIDGISLSQRARGAQRNRAR